MSEPLTIPPPEEIEAQIKAREEEIRALKKLLRMSRAAARACQAHARQSPLGTLRLVTCGKEVLPAS
jgi:hypothetical protein